MTNIPNVDETAAIRYLKANMEMNLLQSAIDTLLILGAGPCQRLDSFLALHPGRLLMVEADPLLAKDLAMQTADHQNVQVICAAVAGNPGPVTFYRYNLPGAAAIHPASGLSQLYPGLKLKEKLEMEAVSACTLLPPLNLQSEGNNQLVIDLPGEELAVLASLHDAELLHFFNRLYLHCGSLPLYQNSEPAERVLDWLRSIGFDFLFKEGSEDPDRPCWVLSRNIALLKNSELEQQIIKLHAQLADANRKSGVLSARVEDLLTKADELKQERDAKSKLAESRQIQLENARQETEAQVREELQTRMEKLQLDLKQNVALVETQRRVIEKMAEDTGEYIKDFHDSIKMQHDRIDQLDKELTTKINKGLENSTKQIESFIGIHNYLSRGQLLPQMHGWMVSPDFAFYLIKLIDENDYDLIIEFGSGTSTVLMAKAVLKRIQRQTIHHLRMKSGTEAGEPDHISCLEQKLESLIRMVPALMDDAVPDYHGIHPRIISFEHHMQFFEITHRLLRSAGVDNFVELIHAPLRDYIDIEGEHFLYYSCEEFFSELGKKLNGSRSRILMVVDGPPAVVTGKHVRYPALPIALQFLAGHSIDLLLDDYNRQDEKEIVDKWDNLLKHRQFVFTKQMLAMEKVACMISINNT